MWARFTRYHVHIGRGYPKCKLIFYCCSIINDIYIYIVYIIIYTIIRYVKTVTSAKSYFFALFPWHHYGPYCFFAVRGGELIVSNHLTPLVESFIFTHYYSSLLCNSFFGDLSPLGRPHLSREKRQMSSATRAPYPICTLLRWTRIDSSHTLCRLIGTPSKCCENNRLHVTFSRDNRHGRMCMYVCICVVCIDSIF